MNYKKIIRNEKLRYFILSLFDWVPDKTMIKIQYRIKTGRKLNLKNPQRFTEKIQWYKLYYRNPLMKKCVDKYEAREYVKTKGLKKILVKSYGVYNNANEIDIEKLPQQFVAKTTTGGGGKNVIICKNKKEIDQKEFAKTLYSWDSKKQKKSYGREWAYDGIKNRIVVEELLVDRNSTRGLIDYKFFCFNGEIRYIYCISNRVTGKSAELGIYDSNFKKIEAYRCDEKKQVEIINRPKNFDKMLMYAKILSKDFPEVRVDLYNIDGKIYFGEMTFYDGSGYMEYEPDSFDYKIGEYFKLEKYNRK